MTKTVATVAVTINAKITAKIVQMISISFSFRLINTLVAVFTYTYQ